MTMLGAFLGGALGATLRYLLETLFSAGRTFAWGMLAANALGSMALGLVLANVPPGPLQVFLGAGFCGALTTFSSYSVATVEFWREGRCGMAGVHIVVHLALGLAAFSLGVSV